MSDLIDRQDVINALWKVNNYGSIYGTSAIFDAIDAVKALPSAQPEKRTEKRTETHACDLISRQAAIDACHNWDDGKDAYAYGYMVEERLQELPSAQPEIVRCKDCRWWNKSDDSPFGYCMAMKHGYMSEHWEIGIYRRYKGDFYCADAEKGNR